MDIRIDWLLTMCKAWKLGPGGAVSEAHEPSRLRPRKGGDFRPWS